MRYVNSKLNARNVNRMREKIGSKKSRKRLLELNRRTRL